MNAIKDNIRTIFAGDELCSEKSEELFDAVFEGNVSEVELAAVLAAMKIRGESPDEIRGAAHSMRKVVTRLTLEENGHLDTCGTGGDHSHSFNLSTASAIVMSAMGYKVAKHGNRSVTSKSGSADFLEAMGIPIQLTGDDALKYYQRNGFIFMFAPNYHPAMKYAAPVRRALGMRTIFNYLGPVTNPAFPGKQMIGVFNRDFLEKYSRVVKDMGYERVLVYSSADGMDEVSPVSPTLVLEIEGKSVERFTIDPGLYISAPDAERIPNHLDAEGNARVFMDTIASRETTPLGKLVAMNTALAMYTKEKGDFRSYYSDALGCLHDGTVLNKVEEMKSGC